MAKIDIRFKCMSDEKDFIKVVKDDFDFGEGILIITREKGNVNEILLDKSTSIRFAKTLRTEINKIQDKEVDNG